MSSELGPGDRLGEYTLEEPIGEGGFSQVWRAHHHRWESRKAAAKVIKDKAHADMLKAEADCLERLEHPGIAGALGMDLDHDPPYLLVELSEGKTLRALLQEKGKLTAPQAFAIFSQLVAALAHSHELGITHGDLKPENVLVDAEGHVKLTDFGLGRVRANEASLMLSGDLHTQDAALAGTIPYMAPEQRDGQAADPTSDVFALGILLHEMLTGKRPQPGDHPKEHLSEAPRWLEVWEKLYTRRDRRLTDARQVADALGLSQQAPLGLVPTAPPVTSGKGPWSLEEVERAVAQETGFSLAELLHHRRRPQEGPLDRLFTWAETQFLGDESQVVGARHLVWYLASEFMDVPHKDLAERYGTTIASVRAGIRSIRGGRGNYQVWRGTVDRLAPLPPSFVKRARRVESGKVGKIIVSGMSFMVALFALVMIPLAGIMWSASAALIPLFASFLFTYMGIAQLSTGKTYRRWVEANLDQVPGETRRVRLVYLALHGELGIADAARELFDRLPAETPRAEEEDEVVSAEAYEPPEEHWEGLNEGERRRRTLEAVHRAMAEAALETDTDAEEPEEEEPAAEEPAAEEPAAEEPAAKEPAAEEPAAEEPAAEELAAEEPEEEEPAAEEPAAEEPAAEEPAAEEPAAEEPPRSADLPERIPIDEAMRLREEALAQEEAAAEPPRKLEA